MRRLLIPVLAGGKVTSAGLIVVKHGVIKSLNPHSGHYRSTIQHYRAFIAQLEAKGADLSHVKIAKSVWVSGFTHIAGAELMSSCYGGQSWVVEGGDSMTDCRLSKYSAFVKGEKDLSAKFKKALGLPHPPTEAEKSAELEKNAQREEAEHQERLRQVKLAEEEEQSEEGKTRARREVLYGRGRQRKEDTKGEVEAGGGL